jgi:hypothetical protein
MKLLLNLWTARGLVIVGFFAAYTPVGATFRHVGDETTRLITSSTHSWHHFFREGVGDLATMVAILAILFAAPRFRNPTLWWVMLILMFGFYGPFWIGVPFMAELGAPSMSAEIAHLQTAIPAVLGCLLARWHFTDVAR